MSIASSPHQRQLSHVANTRMSGSLITLPPTRKSACANVRPPARPLVFTHRPPVAAPVAPLDQGPIDVPTPRLLIVGNVEAARSVAAALPVRAVVPRVSPTRRVPPAASVAAGDNVLVPRAHLLLLNYPTDAKYLAHNSGKITTKKFGAADGDRTLGGTATHNAALCQLSYRAPQKTINPKIIYCQIYGHHKKNRPPGEDRGRLSLGSQGHSNERQNTHTHKQKPPQDIPSHGGPCRARLVPTASGERYSAPDNEKIEGGSDQTVSTLPPGPAVGGCRPPARLTERSAAPELDPAASLASRSSPPRSPRRPDPHPLRGSRTFRISRGSASSVP